MSRLRYRRGGPRRLRDGFGVDPVCRVLELSPSTYFARRQRPKSARTLRDEELIPLVTAVWEDFGRTDLGREEAGRAVLYPDVRVLGRPN
ncbi:hypothetical protein [Streptomyces sp. NPDC086519]|uniref:hypothetical protein n=1 Tax=Streptomyces sp. NPDC086519 TaxID=3154863 RepID=UPI0034415D66